MFKKSFSKNFNFVKDKSFFKCLSANISSRRYQTRFDSHIDWLKGLLLSKHITLATIFAGLNVSLFLYVNLRYNKEKRWLALSGVSYSNQSMKNREYIPLFASLLGSYRLDDLVFETAVLLTLGNKLERLHGSPFMFKLWFFSFAIGILSSLWWVRSNYAKRNRYFREEPLGREYGNKKAIDYRFMSTHGFVMSIVYFYLIKSANKKLVLPILALDLAIWGPYYLSGLLTGTAFGLIL